SNSSDPALCYEYFKFGDGPGIDVFVHNTSIHGQLIGPVPGSKTAGVVGTGPDVGVYGVTADASGIGVFAANTGGGFALEVAGKAEFSTTGQGTIPASKKKFFVSDTRVDAKTQVVVTLTSNPGHDASLVWVQTNPGSGFTIH